MADVYAVFGTLLALGIAFPGMLTAWWLLFPQQIARAEQRVAAAPWRCLGVGIGMAVTLSMFSAVLLALPLGVLKFLGVSLIVLSLGFASLGAAGIAARMSRRFGAGTEAGGVSAREFVLAAVALELAAVFPLIGWFLLIPAALLVSLGASFYAAFRREPAGSALRNDPEPALSQA